MFEIREVAGIRVEEIAEQWPGLLSSSRSLAKWLHKQHNFPAETVFHPSSRVLAVIKPVFFQQPHSEEELYRGKLVAYGKGLVVFEDAITSPSLSGIVYRRDDEIAPYNVLSMATVRFSFHEDACCNFGGWKSDSLLRPEDVLFYRRPGARENNASTGYIRGASWNGTREWLDHWLMS